MCIHTYVHTYTLHICNTVLEAVVCDMYTDIQHTYIQACAIIFINNVHVCVCVHTYVCSNLQTFLLQTWNFDRNGKLYSHTQDNHCIRITALPQPRFSRLAVGWAATAGGGAGLAIFVICGLVYLKKQRLACCGQYSGVAPERKEEDEIVGYTELEVNSCDWPMEHRQVHTYIHTCSHHQWTHYTLMEHTYICMYAWCNPVPRTYVRTCVHTYV